VADWVRCAIYTRKSTEEGLEQEFNSLHAQREACAAYILSQRHEGWRALPDIYDDGGFSGGNMQRPGLVQLLADVAACKVDVIVVYKVDRLTRSLADFARIVDVLDAAKASFVSVTQSFNTTTSMGRLTLNVLLSFAQFEREVTGERIRDKIAASKRKGMWMGGPVPLGYDVIDRKLVVNETEAEQVRLIMERYLELGSVRTLADELAASGIRTKVRPLRDGSSLGGVSFSRGGLFHLLSNCVYVGKVRHKDQTYAGVHDAIVERELWDQVQAALADKAPARKRRSNIRHPSQLAGLVFDAHGREMTPTHAVKQAKRYRYYITRQREVGTPAPWRVPAHDLEQIVVARLARHLAEQDNIPQNGTISDYDQACAEASTSAAELIGAADSQRAEIIASLVCRIDVHIDRVELLTHHGAAGPAAVLTASAALIRSGRQTRLVHPGLQAEGSTRPDEGLLRLIANAHSAREAIAAAGARSFDEVAEASGFTAHYFAQLARLGGLAPDIVTSILEGRQPVALTRTRLARTKALPVSWDDQRRLFGYA
jgi:DNA invertase Pin-like site-specific DNA recombinase